MLRLDGEGAVDAQDQRRRRARRFGVALGAARRPVEPLETGEARDVGPTISGQCETRLASLKPRAASAGPMTAPICAASSVAKGFPSPAEG